MKESKFYLVVLHYLGHSRRAVIGFDMVDYFLAQNYVIEFLESVPVLTPPSLKQIVMYISKWFTLEELIRTDSTSQENNIPSWDCVVRLMSLCRYVLDPVREKYGKTIVVTSGFRTPFLNRLVGGVPSSQHMQGLAADLRCDDPKALFDLIAESDLPFDQLIYYQKKKFVHVSYSPTYRHEVIVKDN